MTEANRLSAAEAIARLSSGALTAEALACACLDRAAERASVKAWKYLDPEHALAQARAADRAGQPGLLAGLPVGVKDIIDTADMPTEHGSPIYRGNRPFADAACVALLRMAGGTILGKTVTTEFANRFPGERIVERFGRCGRRFPDTGGARDADRRLGDPPLGVLRRRRL
jgi:Asp-tRNA(Asn)/Glu-tRNA(Gln) amidotransferase A subunit family amidase